MPCVDPLQTIQDILLSESAQMDAERMALGCPLNNISQEMAGIDDGFQERLEKIYNGWCGAICDALQRGQQSGLVREEVEPQIIATFIISSMQGIIGAAKCMQDATHVSKAGRHFG